ncbi:hypothetical protein NQD34_017608, partial [Periophthalmus magnuspinnatus]
SGIGLALCQRLLTEDRGLRLCLACRDSEEAEAAYRALIASHPGAHVDLLKVDLGSVKSVLRAAAEVRARYSRVDFLYLNAGKMTKPKVDLKAFFKGFFSRNVIHMLETAKGILTQENRVNSDGLQEVFATNLFGHFLLIRELEPLLCQSDHTSRVIWTSSGNAWRSAFSLEDFQHKQGNEPYSSSKYASELLSLALNRHMNSRVRPHQGLYLFALLILSIFEFFWQGLYSSVVCPGMVRTKMTERILLPVFWILFMPIMWLMRIFTNTFTITPYNGAEALHWLFLQKPQYLDPRSKYYSLTSVLGRNYIQPQKVSNALMPAKIYYS